MDSAQERRELPKLGQRRGSPLPESRWGSTLLKSRSSPHVGVAGSPKHGLSRSSISGSPRLVFGVTWDRGNTTQQKGPRPDTIDAKVLNSALPHPRVRKNQTEAAIVFKASRSSIMLPGVSGGVAGADSYQGLLQAIAAMEEQKQQQQRKSRGDTELKPAKHLVTKNGWASKMAAKERVKAKQTTSKEKPKENVQVSFDPTTKMRLQEEMYVNMKVLEYEAALAKEAPSAKQQRNEKDSEAAVDLDLDEYVEAPEDKKPWETPAARVEMEIWKEKTAFKHANYDRAVTDLVSRLQPLGVDVRGLRQKEVPVRQKLAPTLQQDNVFKAWANKRGKFIRRSVNEKEKMHFKEIFTVLDADGGGSIDIGEIQEALAAIGLKMTDDEIKRVMCSMPSLEAGGLDFEEFMQAFVTGAQEWDKLLQVNRARKTNDVYEPALPFDLWIPAFHRAKMIQQRVGEFPEHTKGLPPLQEVEKLKEDQKKSNSWTEYNSKENQTLVGEGPKLTDLWKTTEEQIRLKNERKEREREAEQLAKQQANAASSVLNRCV